MSVHNIRREDMREGDVYIGRAGHGKDGYFGNPYVVGKHGAQGECVVLFERYARHRMQEDATYRARVKALWGKRLFCFCAPKACHGDVLERLAYELVYDDALREGVRMGTFAEERAR